MALINCPECGKEISDKAPQCIHCGYITLPKVTCPECGKELPSDSKVCLNCGYLIEEKEPKTNFTNDEKNLNNQKQIGSKKIPVPILILIVLITAVIAYFGLTTKVPYLSDCEENAAIALLNSNNFVPIVEYRYDDYFEEGHVIFADDQDSRVISGSRIRVVVSKGPSRVEATSSNIEWWNISVYDADDWNFYRPYIEEGYMYISCQPTFANSFKWKNNGFGRASINDSFDKTVPVDIEIENEYVQAWTQQQITLKIPVNDLDVKKPTTLYLELYALDENDNSFNIRISFSISWK